VRELAVVFSKLGATAFGGPAVHVALFEHEVVHRRRWLTQAEFFDLLGATNLIPGPNSTEMAIHVGLRRAGWAGLIVAGVAFIVPAFLIVLVCAWFYVRYQRLPQVQGVLYAVKPIVVVIVLQALWRLSRGMLKTRVMAAVAVVSAVANLLGVHELLLLGLAGAAVAGLRPRSGAGGTASAAMTPAAPPPLAPIALAGATPAAASAFGFGKLFLFFLKVGSVLYGGGYVLLAFLRADLVERWGWLTEAQLLDAVAVGQVTPGPLFTTATFIGYVLGGAGGAVLATLGIFLPSFVFVAISSRILPHIRRSPAAGAFLDGVNAASLALMATVTWHLAHSAVTDATTILLGAGSAAVLFATRTNPTWLILAAVGLGLLLPAPT